MKSTGKAPPPSYLELVQLPLQLQRLHLEVVALLARLVHLVLQELLVPARVPAGVVSPVVELQPRELLKPNSKLSKNCYHQLNKPILEPPARHTTPHTQGAGAGSDLLVLQQPGPELLVLLLGPLDLLLLCRLAGLQGLDRRAVLVLCTGWSGLGIGSMSSTQL